MATDPNANVAAAIAGFALASQENGNYEDDSTTNTNSHNDNSFDDGYNTDDSNNTDNSNHSDNSDNSDHTNVDVGVTDALNDKSTNGSYNDNSDHSDNSDRSDNSDHSVTDSYNDNSDHTNVDVALTDALNDKSTSGSYNDNSDNSDNSDHRVTDSYNDNSDHSDNSDHTSVDVALSDALNNKSVNDSYNDSSNHSVNGSYNPTDSHNDDHSISGSYNPADSYNTTDLNVHVQDAFNHSDFINLDNVGLNGVLSAIGDGAGQAFSLTQISELTDNDTANGTTLTSNAGWSQDGDWSGGDATGIDGGGGSHLASGAGHDGTVSSPADASASAHLEAFNQNISLGANIQYHSMSVVGGDLTDSHHS